MIYLSGAQAERRGLTALGPEEKKTPQPGKRRDARTSFPVPRLQGDGRYRAGGLCKDAGAVSLRSLKEMPAAGQKEKPSLSLLWLPLMPQLLLPLLGGL